MALPSPGQKFEGKYLIDEHIGSGGFAEVFRAHDDAGRAVAIKVLVPVQAEWAQNDPIVERFEREGQLLGQLTNEHTVSMLEMGRTSDGHSPYIVFEYVDGADLANILDSQGPMPAKRVVRVLQQVCLALAEAHDLGVMHRDIKPANIMIYQHMGVQGLAKLLDFGIAKPTGELAKASQDLTSAGMVLGTPRYMAPEQFTGARAAPTSDIYSLGLVAYEMVVGRMAVDAETTTGVFRQQLAPDEFKIPRTANIPPGLRSVILKMTRKTRADRYQTVHEVLHDLANLDQVQAPPSRRAAAVTSNKVLKIGALVAMLAVIAAVIVVGSIASSGGEAPTSEPAPPVEVEPPKQLAIAKRDRAKPEPKPTVVERPEVEKPSPEPTPEPPSTPVPGVRRGVPTDAEGKPLPPPEDDIEPIAVGSSARVKSVATQALTMGDWDRVIGVCKEYGTELTFCARMLADAYRSKGDTKKSCYWFEVAGEQKTGLSCPFEEKYQ